MPPPYRVFQGLRSDRQWQRYSWTEINPADVQFQHDEPPLGSGAFSTVRLARWERSWVAVKIMNDSSCASPETIRILRGEVRVHERLHHDFITHLFGACTMKPKLWLVMEHARKGSLDQYLRRGRGALEPALQVAFLSDIASGMCFLHRRSILHRDLKSQNVLVFDQDRLKLCDFGLAKVTGGSVASAGVGRGTVAWMAPEVFDDGEATEKSDLYRCVSTTAIGMTSRQTPTCIGLPGVVSQTHRQFSGGNSSQNPSDWDFSRWNSDGTPFQHAILKSYMLERLLTWSVIRVTSVG